jgi:hypothetical protein
VQKKRAEKACTKMRAQKSVRKMCAQKCVQKSVHKIIREMMKDYKM